MVKYENVENDDNLPMKFLDFYSTDGFSAIPKHLHDSVEILIPIIGESVLLTNSGKVKVLPGNLYIVNSKEIHGFEEVHKGETRKGFAIQIDYKYLKAKYKNFDHINFHQPNHELSERILDTIFNICFIYLKSNDFKHIEIESYVCSLIYLMFENLAYNIDNGSFANGSANKNLILSIVNYIENHYSDDLSLNYVSNHFGISSGHLSRIFKQNFRISYKQYITNIRLRNAKKDIINTNLPLIDICYNSGFPNEKSLRSAFLREYGLKPK